MKRGIVLVYREFAQCSLQTKPKQPGNCPHTPEHFGKQFDEPAYLNTPAVILGTCLRWDYEMDYRWEPVTDPNIYFAIDGILFALEYTRNPPKFPEDYEEEKEIERTQALERAKACSANSSRSIGKDS